MTRARDLLIITTPHVNGNTAVQRFLSISACRT